MRKSWHYMYYAENCALIKICFKTNWEMDSLSHAVWLVWLKKVYNSEVQWIPLDILVLFFFSKFLFFLMYLRTNPITSSPGSGFGKNSWKTRVLLLGLWKWRINKKEYIEKIRLEWEERQKLMCVRLLLIIIII